MEVEVTVPDDAEVDTVDTLTVTATAADDETISNSDSVTTKVIPLTAGSLTVTIEPSEAVLPGPSGDGQEQQPGLTKRGN